MKSDLDIVAFIFDEIKRCTLGEINPTPSDLNRELINDLGLDSLDFASVMLATEEWLNVSVPEGDVDWAKIRTAKELATMFVALQG